MRFLRAYFFFYFSLHAKMPRTTSPVHSFPWLSCTSCVRVMYSACPFFCQWTRLSYDTVMFYYVTFDSCLFFLLLNKFCSKAFLVFYLFISPSPSLAPILDANDDCRHLESRQILYILYKIRYPRNHGLVGLYMTLKVSGGKRRKFSNKSSLKIV